MNKNLQPSITLRKNGVFGLSKALAGILSSANASRPNDGKVRVLLVSDPHHKQWYLRLDGDGFEMLKVHTEKEYYYFQLSEPGNDYVKRLREALNLDAGVAHVIIVDGQPIIARGEFQGCYQLQLSTAKSVVRTPKPKTVAA